MREVAWSRPGRLSQSQRLHAPASGRGLSRLPLTPSHDAKRDQEKHDSDQTDHVRHPGKRTGDVTRVRPHETDSRPYDEQCDHRSQPVENPSPCDDAEPTLMTAFRHSKRQALVRGRDSGGEGGVKTSEPPRPDTPAKVEQLGARPRVIAGQGS
jgi:hypothetical protein